MSICNKGLSSLVDALRSNKSLETLDIGHTGIGDEGIAILSDALSMRDFSIPRLNLSGNNITDKGVALLSRALRRNTSLRSLDLMDNEDRALDTFGERF